MEPTSSKIYVSKYSGVIAIKTSSSPGFLFTDDNVLAFGQNLYIFQESQVLNFNLWILVNYPLYILCDIAALVFSFPHVGSLLANLDFL